ncbi:SlyX protein [Pseudomonas duriflava]|uniref:Protein SlyX homolog n=1 Tax=Pseudomonas duriflava TaxID=459528 RepID=A0A562QR88_9PSED|nr:SlyX family protein [Pseudomonas duriflava]TWI58596.1 SlyX protein [Pseudomonas duriflava]
MMNDDRIAELEVRQAFQDDLIQTLNDIIVDQQKRIERLQLQVEVLARRQAEMALAQGGGDDEAPPPHY